MSRLQKGAKVCLRFEAPLRQGLVWDSGGSATRGGTKDEGRGAPLRLARPYMACRWRLTHELRSAYIVWMEPDHARLQHIWKIKNRPGSQEPPLHPKPYSLRLRWEVTPKPCTHTRIRGASPSGARYLTLNNAKTRCESCPTRKPEV